VSTTFTAAKPVASLSLDNAQGLLSTTPRALDAIITDAQAAALLQQATFGPTLADITAAIAAGSRTQWVSDQMAMSWSRRMLDRLLLPPHSITQITSFEQHADQEQRINSAIMTTLLGEPAALRSKLVWTLSKLFVISLPGGAIDDYRWGAFWVSWFDRLNTHVFGNWLDLIESITYSLHMSRMLTYYANAKETSSSQPDENYARELMQLFSIGLWELNLDGTYRLNGAGQRIPTYTLADVRQVARALTGLTRWDFNGTTQRYDSADATSLAFARSVGTIMHADLFADPNKRLRHYLPFYETGAKTALNGRIAIPAGTAPEANLRALHLALRDHPNTAPFFAVRMIQHLVTSNPSPGYVARVAARFRDNGLGVVGDLKAVWLAILTDPEASATAQTDADFGRARDGMDIWANLCRSLGRRNSQTNAITQPAGGYVLGRTGTVGSFTANFGAIAPRGQPSIFGTVDPTHQPTEFFGSGLVGPEYQQWPASTLIAAFNETLATIQTTEARDSASATNPIASYAELNLTDAGILLTQLTNMMCGGRLRPGARAAILPVLSAMPVTNATEQQNRIAVALQLLAQTTDFWVQG
jgi:uncharacterized protein (DUF1800 family)